MNKIKKNGPNKFALSGGLTVVELLIILSAIAIVVLISVPGSSMVLENYRLKSTSSDLVNGLSIAKGEAIKRGSTVRVCPSSNGRFCRTDGNWNHGWLVYSDGNGDGTVQEIEFIQSFQAPNPKVSIIATGAVKTIASFTATGMKQDNGLETGEFHICHRGAKGRSKIISVDQDGWVQTTPTLTGTAECGSS